MQAVTLFRISDTGHKFQRGTIHSDISTYRREWSHWKLIIPMSPYQYLSLDVVISYLYRRYSPLPPLPYSLQHQVRHIPLQGPSLRSRPVHTVPYNVRGPHRSCTNAHLHSSTMCPSVSVPHPLHVRCILSSHFYFREFL